MIHFAGTPSVHRRVFFRGFVRVSVAAFLLSWPLSHPGFGQPAAGTKDDAKDQGPPEPSQLDLATTDGVRLSAWYYAPWAAGDEKGKEAGGSLATVILVHDLNGSHESVEPLALKLREAGFPVVAPDLRGHGDSTERIGSSEKISPEKLRKSDLEAVAAVAGGSVRDQASIRGDLEAVRCWIKSQRELDVNRLCVVGSGLGGTLAALWAAQDRAWGDRPLASGSQGDEVRAIVLVSPVFASKGVSLAQAIGPSGLREGLPILLLGGSGDRDTNRIFEQLKRHRPDAWFEQRAGQDPKSAPELKKPADATLFFMQLSTPLAADKILGDPLLSPAEKITGFVTLVMNRRSR